VYNCCIFFRETCCNVQLSDDMMICRKEAKNATLRFAEPLKTQDAVLNTPIPRQCIEE
jgi:hypothetical protein